jgi:6-pyruvoyl-tetrahydropterin synthase
MHGATFAVEAEFRAAALDHHQLLVDIGLAKTELRRLLDTVDYSNLDENPLLRGVNTTTEYMAFHIHRLLAAACAEGRLGHGGRAVTSLKILLREAPTAWAAFEGPLTPEET